MTPQQRYAARSGRRWKASRARSVNETGHRLSVQCLARRTNYCSAPVDVSGLRAGGGARVVLASADSELAAVAVEGSFRDAGTRRCTAAAFFFVTAAPAVLPPPSVSAVSPHAPRWLATAEAMAMCDCGREGLVVCAPAIGGRRRWSLPAPHVNVATHRRLQRDRWAYAWPCRRSQTGSALLPPTPASPRCCWPLPVQPHSGSVIISVTCNE